MLIPSYLVGLDIHLSLHLLLHMCSVARALASCHRDKDNFCTELAQLSTQAVNRPQY